MAALAHSLVDRLAALEGERREEAGNGGGPPGIRLGRRAGRVGMRGSRAQRQDGAGKQADGHLGLHDQALTAFLCRRVMASSALVTAPSCQAGMREACSPASTMRPSMAQ